MNPSTDPPRWVSSCRNTDKAAPPPSGSLRLSGKLLPDPNDPNEGRSDPHAGPAGVPGNDLCANAISVAVPSATAGTTVDAALDSVDTCGTSNTAPGVWYTFTPAQSGALSVDACGLRSRVDFTATAGVPVLVLFHGFGSATASRQFLWSNALPESDAVRPPRLPPPPEKC